MHFSEHRTSPSTKIFHFFLSFANLLISLHVDLTILFRTVLVFHYLVYQFPSVPYKIWNNQALVLHSVVPIPILWFIFILSSWSVNFGSGEQVINLLHPTVFLISVCFYFFYFLIAYFTFLPRSLPNLCERRNLSVSFFSFSIIFYLLNLTSPFSIFHIISYLPGYTCYLG